MFSKLLIANRGEIACRIIKTAQSLGIETVAVYSTADENCQHVKLADYAFCLGAPASEDSYLNINKIIQVAKSANVDAIHPGYGFLSENADFARACLQNQITFVGPSIEALELMGSKQLAKQCLQKADVPLTPGYHGKAQTEATLLKEAKAVGFPVLLKAAAGGGGKGMRRVDDEASFKAALEGAKREAKASFGDDTMLIEKLIEHPRHVEIQLMADNHGQIVHLFERDCSIQRRHQKIIEEAPAPNLPQKLRDALASAAIAVAKTIAYRGAGTVEFLVNKNYDFYFMEMNTRLQVEHPVTEMITGLDLVEWQLRIANNEVLPQTQAQIKAKGHAIECRIYAEDTEKDGLPSTGRLEVFETPKKPHMRLDTGFVDGDEVTRYYDPMVSKLIVWGEDREAAVARMRSALKHYVIGGVKTNLPFLSALMTHPKFKAVELSTRFLTDHIITPDAANIQEVLTFALAATYVIHQSHSSFFNATYAFSALGSLTYPLYYEIDDARFSVSITPISSDAFEWTYEGQTETLKVEYNHQKLIIHHTETRLEAYVAFKSATDFVLQTPSGMKLVKQVKSPNIYTSKAQESSLNAPMPATVVAVLKAEGDSVLAGDDLMVLEAMKMEHTIRAPKDGKLTHIFYPVGSQVDEGVALLELDKVALSPPEEF